MTTPTSIQLIVFDVDGVLTDGAIILDDHGVESKRFHVRDGFAIRAAMAVGIKIGVITGRSSRVVTLRMADLGVDLVMQGIKDKATAFAALCQRAGVAPEDTAFMGDDLIDLPALRRCGYPMAVADASGPVKAMARFVSSVNGGHGAVREAIEHILVAQGKWDSVVERYAE